MLTALFGSLALAIVDEPERYIYTPDSPSPLGRLLGHYVHRLLLVSRRLTDNLFLFAGNDDKFPKLPDGSRDIIWDWNHVDAWANMENVLATGKTKSIGVCNVRLSR